jgi:ABC-type branched-subunit amino acid transport system substrate-binding protein
MVGDLPLAASELTSKVSFPLTAGALGEISGACAASVDVDHAKKVAVIGTDIATTVLPIAACQKVLSVRNITPTVFKVPPNAPDESSYMTRVANSKPDAVVAFSLPSDFPKILQALRQAGYTGPIETLGGLESSYSGKDLNQVNSLLGAKANIAWVHPPVEAGATVDPSLADYYVDMKQYAPKAAITGYSLNAWQSVMAFKAIAEKLPTITRQTFLAAITSANAVTVPGLPTINFTNTGAVPFPGVGRIVNPNALITNFQNGKLVTIKPSFNPLTAP